MKKLLCILLCLLLLAGCGSRPETDSMADGAQIEREPVPSSPSVEETAAEEAADGVGYLTYDSAALPSGIQRATALCRLDEGLCVGGLTRDGAALAWTDWNGEERLMDLPDSVEYVYALCTTEDGFALLGGSLPGYYQNWHGDWAGADAGGALWIVRYDQNGVITGETALEGQNIGNYFQLLLTEDGSYLLDWNSIEKFGPDGGALGYWEAGDSQTLLGMAQGGGEIYVLARNDMPDEPHVLLRLDPETMEAQTQQELPYDSLFGFGQNADGALLLSYGDGDKRELAVLDPDTGELDTLYDWNTLGGSLSADWISQWDQGYVFYQCNKTKLERLRWAAGERPERVTLRMAVIGDGTQISQLVQEFNMSQDACQIETAVYGNASEDLSLDLLRTEILAGNAPDLYCLTDSTQSGSLDLSKLCVDLLPWLDSGGAYSRGDFVQGLLTGMEQGSCLYSMPLSYEIWTFRAPSELISSPGITWEELDAVREQAGGNWKTFSPTVDPETLLNWSAPFLADRFVDRDTGVCRFDSEEFADYLTWCKTWAGIEHFDEAEVVIDPDDKYILEHDMITSMEQLLLYPFLAEANGFSGYTLVGLPAEEGSGSMFSVFLELGISNQTTQTDAAWSFLCGCLSRQGEGVLDGLPVLQSVIDDQLAWYTSGEAERFDGSTDPLPQTYVDQFLEILNHTTAVASRDEALLSILADEAEYFFNGTRTAEEAAAIIQNRASLYIMEQYE